MAIKKQIYIIISAFFLLGLFLVLFFIFPIFSEIRQGSGDLTSQKNNQLILKNQFSEAERFKQKYEEYRANLEKIDSLFVDSQNPVGFIEFLEKTASGLSLKMQISASSFLKEKTSTFASFQFSCSGGFSDTLKFVKELERGFYLIKIQDINIKSRTATTAKKLGGAIGTEISIKAFAK